MSVTFILETTSSAPVETLFGLSLDIDAHRDSMAHTGERAISGVTTGRIGLGQTVTWRARHFGIPFTMTSRISELNEPLFFVDEQVKGPFASFRHRHEFEATDYGTVMRDQVEFAAPFGFLGRLAERLFLGRYMERLIVQRNRHLLATAAVATGRFADDTPE